jgi:serine/threonine-protein kinase
MSADENLLFGVLALQADLLDAGQFAEACSAWAARKETPLADLLVERGWLTSEDRQHVEFLLGRKLKKHNGDVRASLAETTTERVRQSLAGVADADVQQSLAELPTRPFPELGSTTAHVPDGRGRYLLTRLHATGGIGRVWLARDRDLDRDVALKELRDDRADQGAVQSRFLEEARITGQLEHPSIVPVYELVQSTDGQKPFYTMRFVRGRTLSDATQVYHRKRRAGKATTLELRALLGAFVGLCNAVAYAHSRGVIHRDLKGQNVLLGDFGEVMLLDWGLAKVTGRPDEPTDSLPVAPGSDSAQAVTVQGQVLGTPGYMAPEQAEGRLDRIDARTDVYGLGAVLYEILTAEPPFSGPDTPSVLNRILHEPPVRPGERVEGTHRALEAVCLKALAKRSDDRYARASDLAREIEHFLADEPVSACREPVTARVARWGRRHKPFVVGATAVAAAALVALTAGTVLLGRANARIDQERTEAQRQRDAADENARKARQAVNDYFTTVSENTLLKSPLPGLQPLRKDLLQSALTYYQDFVRQNADDPALRSDLAATYLRLGKITEQIGSKGEARQLLEKALTLYRELADAQPGDASVLRGWMNSETRLASVQYQTGQTALAAQGYRQALTRAEPLVRDHPDDPELQHDLASIYNGLGLVQVNSGDPAGAGESFARARSVVQSLVERHPGERKYRNFLAGVYSNNGDVQLAGLAQYTHALRSYKEAVAIQEKLAQEDPTDVNVQDYLATHYSGIANAYFYLGRWPQCLEANEKSVAMCEKLARENPRVIRYQSTLAQGYVNLGQVLQRVKQVDRSLEVAQRAIDLMERGLRELPDEPNYHWALGQALQTRAHALLARNRFPETAAALQQAVAHSRQAIRLAPEMMQYSRDLGSHLLNLGIIQSRLGETARARESWQQAVQVWESYAASHPRDVGYRRVLVGKLQAIARVERAAGFPDDALAAQQRALQVAEDLVRAQPDSLLFQTEVASCAAVLGRSLVAQGRPQQALPPLRRAVEQQTAITKQRQQDAGPRRQLGRYQLALGVAQGNMGAAAEALASLQAARATLEAVAPRGMSDSYNLACIAAQISLLFRRLEPARADAEAERAVQALRDAIAAGYGNVASLAKDPDLDPLRQRADFKKLLVSLAKPKEKAPSGK